MTLRIAKGLAAMDLDCVAPGALADLTVVDGDPLTDIRLIAAEGHNLDLIIRAGEIVKNRLN